MLKLLGTIGVVAMAAAFYESAKLGRATEFETVAARELRKVLRYAAPPTFLASVSSTEESPARLRWLERCVH